MCLRTQKRPKFEGEIDLPSQNKHSLSEMAVDVILSTGMEVNNNYVSPKILNNNEIKDTEKKEDISTPYERLANELINDERASKELSMGKRIGFYRVRGDLGSGNFSQVKMGFHCLTREKVAIKVLDKTKLDQKTQRLLSREISSMEKLRHPNIIRIYEVIETLTKVHIVMEYANGGELFHKILNEGKLPEKLAKRYFAQVVSAIAHMHDLNIIHRDIKAENVFIASNGVVKLGDLGFSTEASAEEALNTFCGSPPYAAPELFKDDNYIGIFVDTWALGVLVYFMVTGTMPFRAETVGKLKRKILEGTYVIPEYVSDSCRFLIRQILRPVPTDRFTVPEIMRCLWLESTEFPKASKKYELKPSLLLTSGSIEEREANKSLQALGVPTDLIENATADSKNSITGTYRILLHQAQRRTSEKLLNPVDPTKRDIQNFRQVKPSEKKKPHRQSTVTSSDSPKSKLCVIL